MTDYTPTTEEVKESYFDWNGGHGVENPIGLYEEFDRWFAEELRKAKAEAWEHTRQELRAIPHWWNTEDQYGEFDLQALGPDKTSEQGAFMHVKQIMDNNPYRQEETK